MSTFTSFLTFYLNPDAGERVGLGVTAILVVVAEFLVAESQLPKVGRWTCISELYMLSLLFAVAALFSSVLTISLAKIKNSINPLSPTALLTRVHECARAVCPLHTVTAKADTCIAAAYVAQHNNDSRRDGGVNPGRPLDAPLSTITASGAQQGAVAAYCAKYFGTGDGAGGTSWIWVTGGENEAGGSFTPIAADDTEVATAARLAVETGQVTAVLKQVPNQSTEDQRQWCCR